ncbi:MAG: DUF2800 domain-containing protein [Acidobacteria bacterium]|nr:DUF2800 domain-containing protein [Acidobacteriota bacterium]
MKSPPNAWQLSTLNSAAWLPDMTAPQPSKHAICSPSSAYKWMTCVGSIAMEKLAGNKDQAGMAASEGTFQHHVAALCLENKTRCGVVHRLPGKGGRYRLYLRRGTRPHGAGLSRHGLGSCW